MDKFLENKWKKLFVRARLFRFIPFIDFVLVAGSMAVGNPKEDSDFDVIVGAKSGRIFTVRAFCILFFGLLGWRKTASAKDSAKADRFCFSHFVTPERYRLAEPHNEYWKKLYLSLVLIYGAPDLIQKFYDANEDWLGKVDGTDKSDKFNMTNRTNMAACFEKLLSGRLGNLLEAKLKKIQIKKIEKSLKTENLYKPRIIYTDSELEFHPDTKRIEEFCGK